MSFRKVRAVSYPDRQCDLIEYVHDETGLRHFHLDSKFPELLFSLALPTEPEDDTGLPHILEHLTLSGGEKYPVKDPFMRMVSRSVAHDMNAMTMHMSTNYHFATTLEKDFFNLSDVFLDAVFTPLLRREDFEQEGWRIEQKEDKSHEIKGVVFNEMKGVYAEPGMHMRDAIYRGISPDTSLSYSSGGHPLCIPGISYERLCDFHSRKYNPNQAVLTTSGAVDIDKLHLQVEDTLERYKNRKTVAITQKDKIIPQIAFNKDFGVKENGVITTKVLAPLEEGDNLFIPYEASSPNGAKEELFDQLMCNVLFNSSNSQVHVIADKFSVEFGVSYLFNDFIEVLDKTVMLFSVSGDKDLDVNKWKCIVEELWDGIAQKGISVDDWNSSILSFRKGSIAQVEESPSGVVMDISACAVRGIDPLINANNLEILEELEKHIPTKQELIAWCNRFRDNPLCAIITQPDPDILSEWLSKEKDMVESFIDQGFVPNPKLKSLDDDEQRRLESDMLPFIEDSDLASPVVHDIPIINISSTKTSTALSHFEANTPMSNIRVAYDVGAVSPSLHTMMVMNVWSLLSRDFGTKDKSALEQKNWEENKGVSVAWAMGTEVDLNGKVGVMIQCIARSLSSHADDMVQAISDKVAGAPMFEEEKWRASISRLLDSVKADDGSRHRSQAVNASMAPFSSSSALREQLSDYSDNNLEQWLETALKDPKFAFSEFEELFEKIKTSPRMVVSIGDKKCLASANTLTKIVNDNSVSTWDDLSQWTRIDIQKPFVGSMKSISSPVLVNHCFYSYPAPRISHPDAAATSIAVNMLDPVLHKIVREEGGAYGVSASWRSGIVSFSSYRDPNLEETFATFENVPEFLEQIIQAKDDQSLKEAKLRIFKSFTAPRSARDEAAKRLNMVLTGLTSQHELDLLKSSNLVSWDDLQKVAKDWLSPSKETVSKSAVVSSQRVFIQEEAVKVKSVHKSI